ncbi:MAG: amidophosphoribosyltransferase, partial [SAR202 cluster bacterium]|nr:amidophosphoribosyltransferase [SAR202 cluster bacterium]
MALRSKGRGAPESIRTGGAVAEPLQEACGIVGVYAPKEDVARLAFFGLFSLQHRGQESAGIATSDGQQLFCRTEMGLVTQAFHEFDLQRLPGAIAIGHTRYSTTGSSVIHNAQPFVTRGVHGQIALGHNGNVINAADLRRELALEWGCTFATSSDSEVILQMLANAPGADWGQRWAHVMRRVQGAYSLVVLTPNALMAARDPLGVRPLCLGSINGSGWVVASETCALDHVGAKYVRDIAPGEVVLIDERGPRSIHNGSDGRSAACVFEFIYFARPDSRLDGRSTYESRVAMGRQLAREHAVDADVVIGVPDSATAAAAGYSQESGLPYREGLVKNRYVGRTFIAPDQRIRDLGVRLKFNPLPEVLSGRR